MQPVFTSRQPRLAKPVGRPCTLLPRAFVRARSTAEARWRSSEVVETPRCCPSAYRRPVLHSTVSWSGRVHARVRKTMPTIYHLGCGSPSCRMMWKTRGSEVCAEAWLSQGDTAPHQTAKRFTVARQEMRHASNTQLPRGCAVVIPSSALTCRHDLAS